MENIYFPQRNMARLLYWGQQGLQRNLQEAVKYYEKAAETGDPAAMYDYGVVLVKVSSLLFVKNLWIFSRKLHTGLNKLHRIKIRITLFR